MTRFCFVWEKVSKSWVFLDLRKKYARKGDGQTKLAHFVRLEFSYFPASQAPRGTFSTLSSGALSRSERREFINLSTYCITQSKWAGFRPHLLRLNRTYFIEYIVKRI